MALFLSMHMVTLYQLFNHSRFYLRLVLLATHHFLLPMLPHLLNPSQVLIFGLLSALACLFAPSLPFSSDSSFHKPLGFCY